MGNESEHKKPNKNSMGNVGGSNPRSEKILGENTGTPVLPVSPVFPHDWNMAYVSEQKK